MIKELFRHGNCQYTIWLAGTNYNIYYNILLAKKIKKQSDCKNDILQQSAAVNIGERAEKIFHINIFVIAAPWNRIFVMVYYRNIYWKLILQQVKSWEKSE